MGITIDRDHETVLVYSPVFSRCVHRVDGLAKTCDAFPVGILLEIWKGQNGHTRPYPGDNGVRFEQLPGVRLSRRSTARVVLEALGRDWAARVAARPDAPTA